jgi:hypothetical protein
MVLHRPSEPAQIIGHLAHLHFIFPLAESNVQVHCFMNRLNISTVRKSPLSVGFDPRGE